MGGKVLFLDGSRMQVEGFGERENVWERGHRAWIPVSSCAQPVEGRVRLPQGSVGLMTGPLGDYSRDVEQGNPRVRGQALLRVPRLGNPAQLFVHWLEQPVWGEPGGPAGTSSWVAQGVPSLQIRLGSFL